MKNESRRAEQNTNESHGDQCSQTKGERFVDRAIV
jgi:hypothetical protein